MQDHGPAGTALPRHGASELSLATDLAATCAWIAPATDVRAVAGQLLERLVAETGATRGSLMAVNPATGRLAIMAAIGLRSELIGEDVPPRPRSISEWVLRNRRGLVLNGDVRDQRFEATAAADHIESALCLPLSGSAGPIGVLNLARLSPAPMFGDAEMAALEQALGPVAASLERALRARIADRGWRRLEAVSSGSGSTLVPPGSFEVRHYEMALCHRPSAFLSGDRCERVPHPDGGHSLLLLDPVGDGAVAAATAAFVQGLFVALASPERSAAGMAARVNAELHARLGAERFAALWIAQLEKNGELAYCAAGHAPALWMPRDGGEVTRLDRGGPPAGALAQAGYEEEHLRLVPGDVVLVASDGVLDARGTADQPFGLERVAELAAELRRNPLDRLVEAVADAARDFSGREVPTDDFTVLALRYTPGN